MYSIKELNQLAGTVHATAIEKGWYRVDDTGRAVVTPQLFKQKCILKICELAEAYEEYRKPEIDLKTIYYKDGKPEGFPVEVADCLIRTLDSMRLCGRELSRLVPCAPEKMEALRAYPGDPTEACLYVMDAILGEVTAGIGYFDFDDVISYICHLIYALDIEAEVRAATDIKVAFNMTRPARHGNKKA
jgi:hypothetical protein